MTFSPDFGVATKNKAAHICLICCAFYFPMLLELERKFSLLDRHTLEIYPVSVCSNILLEGVSHAKNFVFCRDYDLCHAVMRTGGIP
jgi:hypothetical protein